MSGRQRRGRQRIPIRLIENQDDLYATFSKRRHGLYTKASELCTQCGVDIGVIIFSPSDNPYSFFHPNMESVIDRYRNPDQPLTNSARAIDSHARSRVDDLNRRLDGILDERERLKEHSRYLDEIDQTRQKGWWEAPVEILNKEQVKEWIEWFQAFKAQIQSRIEEPQNGGSTSTTMQQQNPPSFPYVPGPSGGVGYAPPVGPSYAPPMASDQFPSGAPSQGEDSFSAEGSGHFSNQHLFPPLAQDSFVGGGSSHNPDQYFCPPPPHEGPSGDGGSGPIPGQFFYLPTPQVPSRGGGSVQIPSQYFYPPTPQNPLGGGGIYPPPPQQDPSCSGSAHISGQFLFPPPSQDPSGGGGSSHFLSQYIYPPPRGQDPSTARGSGEAGPSNQGGN